MGRPTKAAARKTKNRLLKTENFNNNNNETDFLFFV